MVCDLGSLGFVCADDGNVAEIALLSPFIDDKAAIFAKLLIKDEVLHFLWKKEQNTLCYS